MNIKIILLFLFFTSFGEFKANNQTSDFLDKSVFADSISVLNSKIKKLEQDIGEIKFKSDNLYDIYSRSFTSISNQIDASSYNLTIFAFLFGLALIGIGIYVTVIERKIVKISDESKSMFTQSQEIQEEIKSLNELIQKDINGLYLKIKREETVSILDRLVLVPQDIANVSTMLLSRDLEEDDYLKIKLAYQNLGKNAHKGFISSYLLLFFQHFLDKAIKDDEILKDIIGFFDEAILCSFENDILNSTASFIAGVLDLGISTSAEVISKYFKSLANSKYKDLEEINSVIFDGLMNRQNRFLLLETMASDTSNNSTMLSFGTYLTQKYSAKVLNENETNLLQEYSTRNA